MIQFAVQYPIWVSFHAYYLRRYGTVYPSIYASPPPVRRGRSLPPVRCRREGRTPAPYRRRTEMRSTPLFGFVDVRPVETWVAPHSTRRRRTPISSALFPERTASFARSERTNARDERPGQGFRRAHSFLLSGASYNSRSTLKARLRVTRRSQTHEGCSLSYMLELFQSTKGVAFPDCPILQSTTDVYTGMYVKRCFDTQTDTRVVRLMFRDRDHAFGTAERSSGGEPTHALVASFEARTQTPHPSLPKCTGRWRERTTVLVGRIPSRRRVTGRLLTEERTVLPNGYPALGNIFISNLG